MRRLADTHVWNEALGMPETLAATLADTSGAEAVAAVLAGPGARRIVATGNGAALYCAQALWLASLVGRPAPVEVVAVPAGLLADGFAWRSGDRLLVVSSSGELRDVLEALGAGAPRPYAAITSSPGSTIARGAGAMVEVAVRAQEAVTHTQAFCGNALAVLAVWARVTGDRTLSAELERAGDAVARALPAAAAWVADALEEAVPLQAIAFGSGPAWAAALEAALLLKEIARVPAEGLETREGATSGMYALAAGAFALSLPTGKDPRLEEAELVCEAAGAAVLRAPGGELADPRLATLTTFPAALAFATTLGLEAGRDVDRPPWADAYYATARVKANTEVSR